METAIFLLNEEDERIVRTAIEKANKSQGWNITYEIKRVIYKSREFNDQKYVVIHVSECEHLLYLGMYMAKLGF